MIHLPQIIRSVWQVVQVCKQLITVFQSKAPLQVSGMKMRNLLFGVILGLLAFVHSTPLDSKFTYFFLFYLFATMFLFLTLEPTFSYLVKCLCDFHKIQILLDLLCLYVKRSLVVNEIFWPNDILPPQDSGSHSHVFCSLTSKVILLYRPLKF